MSRLARVLISLLALVLLASGVLAGELRRQRLRNGLEVLMREAHGSPMVASIVTVGAGSRHEDTASYGATHFLEHMTFNGTATRSREDINEGVKEIGGYINAFTRREYVCYILLVPREHLREGLALQADMIFDSQLPPGEFEKEKRVVVEEMLQEQDSGHTRAEQFRSGALLGGTAYDHPVLGTAASIEGLTQDGVMAYYRSRYVPANSRLFLVGDFTRREALALLRETYGRHRGAAPPPGEPVDLDWPAAPTWHATAGGRGQPSLELVWPAPAMTAGGYAAQLVLAELLGDSHRSPLLGEGTADLAFSAGVEAYADFSFLTLSVDPGERPVNELLPALAARLGALADWVPDAGHVADAANALRVEDVFLQDTYHYYAMMKSAELALGGHDLLDSYREALMRLDPPAVRGALERSLLAAPPRLLWTAADGEPAAMDGATLAAFAPSARHVKVTAAPRRERHRESARPAYDRVRRGETRRGVLDNGLTVLVKADPASEVLAAHLLVRGRSAREPRGKAGIANLAHRLLAAGTAVRDEAAIDAVLTRLGAQLKTVDNPWIPFDDYYTREDFSYVRLETLDESAGEALALLAELAGEAAYPEAAVERERGRVLGALRRGAGSPSAVARETLGAWLFPEGGRGLPAEGLPETVATITAENLRAFHAQYFNPRHMILSIVTSRPAGDIFAMAADAFGALPGAACPPILASRPQAGPHEDRCPLDKSQVSILATRVTPPVTETDPALRVLVDVLSARLGLELRETQGLAYSVGAGLRFVPGLAPGARGFGLLTMQISTGVENLDQARSGMMTELRRLAAEPPSPVEIARATGGRRGRELMRDLSRIHQAYRMGLREHLGLDPFDWREELEVVGQEVTPEVLAAQAEQLSRHDDWIWILAGGGLR
ncbi:MAG: insulinase family protein [Candidatus Krumholzibacteriota bacterium]|nr:insulinase family protein [Candidatus Krumholzibacteriota bacterium]